MRCAFRAVFGADSVGREVVACVLQRITHAFLSSSGAHELRQCIEEEECLADGPDPQIQLFVEPEVFIAFNAVPMLQSKGEPLDIIGLEPLKKLLTVILQHLISPPIVFALHG